MSETALTPKIRRAMSVGGQAVGAVALGALAVGALALGALAIGRLAIGRARIRRVEIDELVVHRLRVNEGPSVAGETPANHPYRLGNGKVTSMEIRE
jgi:hypothetical protein